MFRPRRGFLLPPNLATYFAKLWRNLSKYETLPPLPVPCGAIDLDAGRLEIRHVKEIDGGSIRCIYPKESVGSEREILDREVRVHGRYEQHVDGKPRLMEAVKLDVVG